MEATFWALLPPIIAIILALLTKEVYVSLMLGIITGALLYTKFNVIASIETTFDIMGEKIGSNVDILIFLVMIGIIVALITSSGASKAYGNWATKTIKSKRGALLATSCLGALILKTIPYNMYALFTIVFVLFLIITGIDFSKMKKYEDSLVEAEKDTEEEKVVGKGKVVDLVLPIAFLIVFCIVSMLYTGGLFKGVSVVNAFADCNASRALVIGSFITIVFTFVLYIPRKVINFSDYCSSFVNGFKAMTPAIMILCMAWTLSGICSEEYLNIGGFVNSVIGTDSVIGTFLPVVFFLISMGLAFATGTSWGTFGILIPIAVAVFGNGEMLTLCVAFILSGAVCGDHISPISDTTILSSAGADCKHIDHVATQIPYAMIVAACSFVGFLFAGILDNGIIGLTAGGVCLVIVMTVIFMKYRVKSEKN